MGLLTLSFSSQFQVIVQHSRVVKLWSEYQWVPKSRGLKRPADITPLSRTSRNQCVHALLAFFFLPQTQKWCHLFSICFPTSIKTCPKANLIESIPPEGLCPGDSSLYQVDNSNWPSLSHRKYWEGCFCLVVFGCLDFTNESHCSDFEMRREA